MVGEETDAVLFKSLPDGICLISVNRTTRRNAVNGSTAQKLHDAFQVFEASPQLKVCVFHGQNGTFCAGADLHEVSNIKGDEAERRRQYLHESIAPMGPSRMMVRKPVIAAVPGYAVAGGLELSLLADIRIAEEDTIFGVFCRRWGVPLIDGGTVRLQKVIGLGRALDMILTGRPVAAEEALQMGLANRVVPKGRSLDAAIDMARQLLKFPELCMNVDRDSVYYTAYFAKTFQDSMKYEYERGWPVIVSESIKGAARFSKGAGRHGTFEDEVKAKL